MGSPHGQFSVSADDLRTASANIETTADTSARNVDEFDGQQSARSAAAASFDIMTAARSCEQGWQQAVEVRGAKLAVFADNLNLNADAYVSTEQQIASNFRR